MGVLYELVINFIVLYVSNCIRILIFTGIEVLLVGKFSPINLRTGTKAPVLKIEKGVLNELVINFIVFYVSNCIRILIFTGIDVLIGCKVSLISLRTGNEPPVLKIAFRGTLQFGSVSHRFLRLKLHKSGKFDASIKFCTIDVTSDLTIRGTICMNGPFAFWSLPMLFTEVNPEKCLNSVFSIFIAALQRASVMPCLVERQRRSFSESDRSSIHIFLLSLPPVPSTLFGVDFQKIFDKTIILYNKRLSKY